MSFPASSTRSNNDPVSLSKLTFGDVACGVAIGPTNNPGSSLKFTFGDISCGDEVGPTGAESGQTTGIVAGIPPHVCGTIVSINQQIDSTW